MGRMMMTWMAMVWALMVSPPSEARRHAIACGAAVGECSSHGHQYNTLRNQRLKPNKIASVYTYVYIYLYTYVYIYTVHRLAFMSNQNIYTHERAMLALWKLNLWILKSPRHVDIFFWGWPWFAMKGTDPWDHEVTNFESSENSVSFPRILFIYISYIYILT